MSLLESYDKNKKKHLLKEVTGTGAVGGFVGGAGDYIDQKFSGGFHPEFNELKNTLKIQVDNDIIKRMWNDDNTPMAEQDFIDLELNYEYDVIINKDNSKFKSTSETEMQLVDIDIKYDKIIDKTEENKKFINDTSNWKSIYDNKKY
jgi:tRNA U34 5-carboxymethylaminomethyl modifying enzyme MnmG/GidA